MTTLFFFFCFSINACIKNTVLNLVHSPYIVSVGTCACILHPKFKMDIILYYLISFIYQNEFSLIIINMNKIKICTMSGICITRKRPFVF